MGAAKAPKERMHVAALLTKQWEPLKPLKSGCTWSHETTAKYVTGEEVVSILGRHGIAAVCDPDC